MDSNIDELVKKYWACETTLEEEEQLRQYFAGNNIPEHLRETASLFQYFRDQQQLTTGHVEHTVVAPASAAPKGRLRSLVITSLRIAAGVAVLLTAVYVVRTELHQDDPVAMEDTYEDPQQAFEETKKALLMISKGFGRAEQQTRKINLFNEAQEKIKTTTEPAKETKL